MNNIEKETSTLSTLKVIDPEEGILSAGFYTFKIYKALVIGSQWIGMEATWGILW